MRILLLLAVAAGCDGATLLTNLPVNGASSASFNFDGVSRAMGFTMGADPYSIESAALRLNVGTPTNVSMQLTIYSNNGSNNPGSQLAAFTNPVFVDDQVHDYIFLPVVPFVLQPNTTYWLVLSRTGGEGFAWYGNSPSIDPSGIAAVHFGERYGGVTPPFGTTGFSAGYQLDGELVTPEPSSFALTAALPLLLAISRLRLRSPRCRCARLQTTRSCCK